jgi:pyridoxine kinase
VTGIAERGALRLCDGVLSGYMGSADIGEAILDTVLKVRRANPAARYCCDPVIGDVGRGIFVRPGIPEFMRDRALPAADVVTPNQFELDLLSGKETKTLADAVAAVAALHARGPGAILVTSLETNETPDDSIDLLASDGQTRCLVRTPKLPISVNGAGDAIAALFFAHYLQSQSVVQAVSAAASSVFGILKRTAEKNSREILLIDAQDEIVKPSRVFDAAPL